MQLPPVTSPSFAVTDGAADAVGEGRAKLLVGVGALLTEKKLKCQTCGEYNDTGNAQPFKVRKHARGQAWEKEQSRKSAAQRASVERLAELAAAALLEQVVEMQAAGVTADDSGEPVLNATTPAPPTPPPRWHPDLLGGQGATGTANA